MKKARDTPIGRAVGLIKAGRYEEAVDTLEAFVKDNPHSIEAWYNMGVALAECNRDEDAVKAYDEALAIDNMIFEVWFNKGTVLYQMKDFKGSKECYEKAIEINPDDAEAWNNLGNCLSRLGEGKKAIDAYTQAVALKPDYAEAFYNKANAHFIEEDDEHAIAYGEIAVKLDPKLDSLVQQWIHVSRARLEAAKQQEEYERKTDPSKRIDRDLQEPTDGST